jgi:guanylate kinase
MNDARLKRRGLMFVLSSPSGAGKTTLSRKLLEVDMGITMSVSATTRPMRNGERDGVDYRFVSQEKFAEMIQKGELLEHATVFGNSYGTPRNFVYDQLDHGRDVLFDIDWQGTRQLKEKNRVDLVSVFILPPSLHELERRLKNRAQDSDEVVARRMEKAAEEISHWDEYDYVIINDDLEQSLSRVKAILNAERCRRERQQGLADFVRTLPEDWS